MTVVAPSSVNELTSPESHPDGGVQSVLRSLQIFEIVARRQPVRLAELVPEVGLPKSTTQRALKTLESAGWITAPAADLTRWVVTERVRELLGSRDQIGLREAALPAMRELRDVTGEGVHLSVPSERYRTVIIDRLDSTHELQIIAALGTTFPMAVVASGLAMLTRASNAEVAAAITDVREDDGTLSTVTDHTAVEEVISHGREHGWVARLSPSGLSVGVASPVMSSIDEPIAAIALVVPVMRVVPERLPEFGAAVCKAAEIAGARLSER